LKANIHNQSSDHIFQTFEVMTLTLPQGTYSSVAPLLAAILYKAFHNRNHMLWNIGLSEKCIESKYSQPVI
jgi:hypothetical protein